MTPLPHLAEWRKATRAELLCRRMNASSAEHEAWSRSITKSLECGFPVLQDMVIGFYWPCKNEFDTRSAIQFFHHRGARLALPMVTEKDLPLQFREWWPGVSTVSGAYDIPVPNNTRILIPDALLVPVVGFSEQGDRLGYGGGFFDRTIEAISPPPLKIAVAFELSRIATTHPQPHDAQMDFVVTEAGIHLVDEKTMRQIGVDECEKISRQLVLGRGLPRVQEELIP